MAKGAALAGRQSAVRLLIAQLGLCLVVAAACSQSSSRYEPTTTRLGGRTVFIIYRPPCPKNASCAAEVVINKQLYEYPGAPPRMTYRTGPLYAVGTDSEARTLSGVESTPSPVLALRIGTDWHVAIPFSAYPITATLQREICAVTVNDPRSYCVTHFKSLSSS